MESRTDELQNLCATEYEKITRRLIATGVTVAAMESCTAGLISSLLTDTEGASAVFRGAFVTYSNGAKVQCGVPEEVISRAGVYSRETAVAMAEAARENYAADLGIGVTGSLGNVDPNNPDSVPGEVWFAVSRKEGTEAFFLSGIAEPTRFFAKLRVAHAVAGELIRILRA